jgi:hypothetical protein
MAADTVAAGDTVHVRAGVYEERVTVAVSGTPGNPVTFRSFAGETAILDGTNLPPSVGDSAMLWIENRSHVVIQGLEIRNYRTANNQCFPIGIMVLGAGTGIELRDNGLGPPSRRVFAGHGYGVNFLGSPKGL